MLRNLLVLTLLFSSVICLAQREALPVPSQTKTISSVTSVNGPAALSQPTNARSAVIDTLFPAILSDTCASLAVFNTPEGGFVFGTNEFFDFEKMQRLTLEEPVDFTVSDVFVGFVFASPVIADKPISIKIYPPLDADGNLQAPIGTSDTLLVGQTAANDTTSLFTRFTFSTPVALQNTDNFFVSVDLSGIYFNPDGTVDTVNVGDIAIASTDDGCGDGNNVLEIFPTQDALGLATVFQNWQGLNAEMYVGAIIDRGTFTSTRTQQADYAATVAPNPANEELNVSFTAPTSGTYRARILSTNGALLQVREVPAVAGPNQLNLTVGTLPAGIYLFQVEGINGIQTGKFVKR